MKVKRTIKKLNKKLEKEYNQYQKLDLEKRILQSEYDGDLKGDEYYE